MRDTLVQPSRTSVLGELFVFALVGGTGALAFVGLSALTIGLRTGIPDWVMSALCWMALIGPVYLGHRHLSFRSEAPHRQALPRYALIQVCGIALAALFSYVCYGILGLPTLAAAMIVTALTSGVNFAIVRSWAFAEGH